MQWYKVTNLNEVSYTTTRLVLLFLFYSDIQPDVTKYAWCIGMFSKQGF